MAIRYWSPMTRRTMDKTVVSSTPATNKPRERGLQRPVSDLRDIPLPAIEPAAAQGDSVAREGTPEEIDQPSAELP